jgi:hypothetical protein
MEMQDIIYQKNLTQWCENCEVYGDSPEDENSRNEDEEDE